MSSHLNNQKLSSPTCSTQIQTTATVHSQNQKPGPQAAASAQNQRSVKSSIGGGGITSSIIPPKYQPPPQPLLSAGGILKQHLSTPKPYFSANYFVGDLTTPDELNIKYPPDIPKLSSIYIPEPHSEKNHHHLRRQPLQRISSGGQQYVLEESMLKFVRKADQEHGVAISNIPAPGGGGRLTSEQNRHLQRQSPIVRYAMDAYQRENVHTPFESQRDEEYDRAVAKKTKAYQKATQQKTRAAKEAFKAKRS
ncbi:CCDC85C.2 family protein [Megaselia abdita]